MSDIMAHTSFLTQCRGNSSKYLATGIGHPLLRKTDSGSIRTSQRSYEKYPKEIAERDSNRWPRYNIYRCNQSSKPQVMCRYWVDRVSHWVGIHWRRHIVWRSHRWGTLRLSRRKFRRVEEKLSNRRYVNFFSLPTFEYICLTVMRNRRSRTCSGLIMCLFVEMAYRCLKRKTKTYEFFMFYLPSAPSLRSRLE